MVWFYINFSAKNIKICRKDNVAENYREAILEIATGLVNKPSVKYKSGYPELGQSPRDGFDCSGFVRFVLRTAGLAIPDYIGMDGLRRSVRHANEFWDNYGISVHQELRQSGDLIFFSRTGKFPTHIGIICDEETYIHAPGRDGTKVEIRSISRERIEVDDSTGVLYHTNPVGFKSPTQAIEQPTYRYHQAPI